MTWRAWIVPVWIAFFVATNWPVLALANRIEPRIGPFPFLVCWMLVCSLGVGILHLVYGLGCMKDPRIPERTPVAEAGEPAADDLPPAPPTNGEEAAS